MIRIRRPLLLVLLAALALPSLAHAQQARIDVLLDGVQACDFSRGMGTIGTATVRVTTSFPFTSLRLKAPAPCGLIVLNTTSPFPFTGSPQTGVTITPASCVTVDYSHHTDVLQIQFFAPAEVSNCTWDVFPANGDADIKMIDCDGYAMKGASARSLYCGDVNGYIGPYRPNPPDGATNVPINTLLSFVGNANLIGLTTDPTQYPTNYPICDTSISELCPNPFDPGLLQPHTTYRWMGVFWCAGSCPHGEGGYSDIWSFTTGDAPLATAPTTWGAIKSLYRD